MSYLPNTNNATPEGAILLLESAYNLKNLDKVFELIDFRSEAEIMIKNVLPKVAGNEEIISETATALKLSLEKNLIDNGWPTFDSSNIVFESEYVSKDLLIVTKIVLEDNVKRFVDRLYVKKQPDNTYKVSGSVS